MNFVTIFNFFVEQKLSYTYPIHIGKSKNLGKNMVFPNISPKTEYRFNTLGQNSLGCSDRQKLKIQYTQQKIETFSVKTS